MKERPIIFSGELVRAILEGRKTMTRRVVKPQPDYTHLKSGVTLEGKEYYRSDNQCKPISTHGVFGDSGDLPCFAWVCPYGVPGDRLWVRETWATQHKYDAESPRDIPKEFAHLHYMATEDKGGLCVRPSIFMPRWASRITLEITRIEVDKLVTINYIDAQKEGFDSIESFGVLWDKLNSKRGASWKENPWVWILEFQRV